MNLPSGVEDIIAKGYSQYANRSLISYESGLYKKRVLSRKWRNLTGECRFDIPQILWEYVDWTMPLIWQNDFYKIKSHAFIIKIPNILPLAIFYREYQNGNDWFFQSYEIITPSGDLIISKRQEELNYFLHICYELVKPHKRKVIIEALPYKELDDGAIRHPLEQPLYEGHWYC